MNMHKDARLTPKGRELLIERLERGEHPTDVSCAMEVSVRTVCKWCKRYRDCGLNGLPAHILFDDIELPNAVQDFPGDW